MVVTFQNTHTYEVAEDSKHITADGAVYKAIEEELGRPVAIKQVSIAGDTPWEREANVTAALREVQVMIRCRKVTKGIPVIYTTHYDEAARQLYIVMEWIDGKPLGDVMWTVSDRQFLIWMKELVEILQQLERENVTHKDIKPDNLMILDNKLVLIDFNISMSVANTVEGTLHYKAPEMDSDSKDRNRDKVDMFSIGVLLYEYFTHCLPKRGTEYTTSWCNPNGWSTFVKPSKKKPGIPEIVEQIICTCMERKPKNRYANMSELKVKLGEAVNFYDSRRKK